MCFFKDFFSPQSSAPPLIGAYVIKKYAIVWSLNMKFRYELSKNKGSSNIYAVIIDKTYGIL